MKRFEDWPRRLSEFLDQHREKPFVWGENDCVYFVGKAVEALTGEDHYTEYVYETEQEASQIMSDNGGIAGLIKKALGKGHSNIYSAKRGDIVIMKLPEITAGVVDDSGEYIASLSKDGITRLPLKRAWRVWSY